MKFLTLLRWEFSSLLRLRFILALIAFMFFTTRLTVMLHGFGGLREVVKSGEIVDRLTMMILSQQLGAMGFNSLAGMYLALAFFSSLLVPAQLTSELETGVLKFYASLPASRLKIFLVKFLSVLLLMYLSGLSAIYYSMFMSLPSEFITLICASPFSTLQPALSLIFAILFTLSISFYFSVISGRAWHASVYSLITLYSFYTIREVVPGTHWFFPPYIFLLALYEMTGMLYMLCISLLLLALSCYLFMRRLEVT